MRGTPAKRGIVEVVRETTAGELKPAPWNWTELPRTELAARWAEFTQWVDWLEAAYAPWVRTPPCWPAHDGLADGLRLLHYDYERTILYGIHPPDAVRWHRDLRRLTRSWHETATCRHEPALPRRTNLVAQRDSRTDELVAPVLASPLRGQLPAPALRRAPAAPDASPPAPPANAAPPADRPASATDRPASAPATLRQPLYAPWILGPHLPESIIDDSWARHVAWVRWLQAAHAPRVRLPACWPAHEGLALELRIFWMWHRVVDRTLVPNPRVGLEWHVDVRAEALEWQALADCRHEPPARYSAELLAARRARRDEFVAAILEEVEAA